jgi:hypothetical protein
MWACSASRRHHECRTARHFTIVLHLSASLAAAYPHLLNDPPSRPPFPLQAEIKRLYGKFGM